MKAIISKLEKEYITILWTNLYTFSFLQIEKLYGKRKFFNFENLGHLFYIKPGNILFLQLSNYYNYYETNCGFCTRYKSNKNNSTFAIKSISYNIIYQKNFFVFSPVIISLNIINHKRESSWDLKYLKNTAIYNHNLNFINFFYIRKIKKIIKYSQILNYTN